jgi:hypothetical protein
MPRDNPFLAFKERFGQDLEWLIEAPIETFHRYSFATLRQYGACYELVSTYLEWLKEGGEADLDGPIEAFREIATSTKAFQFQLARAIARRRQLPLESLDRMAELWRSGVEPVVDRRHLADGLRDVYIGMRRNDRLRDRRRGRPLAAAKDGARLGAAESDAFDGHARLPDRGG